MAIRLRRMAVDARRGESGVQWWFWCPGCQMPHAFRTKRSQHPSERDAPTWTFDGNEAAPTFSPSLLADLGEGRRCHLFLRAGQLQFLGDCTHALAGQTVPLPEYPE